MQLIIDRYWDELFMSTVTDDHKDAVVHGMSE